MSMEGLRQGAQSVAKTGGKGPQRAAFFARWKPPQMSEALKKYLSAPPSEESFLQVSEPVVLLQGAYPDLYARNQDGSSVSPPPVSEAYRFRAHTFPVFIQPKSGQGFKSFREVVCSAGHEPHAPQPCVGCYQVDHGAKDSRARDQWAFNIAHLGWYHSHPYMKDGQIVTKKGSQDPIMVKDECLSHKMENVIIGRAAQAQAPGIKKRARQCDSCGSQHPFAWGDHRVLQIGFKHLKRVLELDDELGKKCANCNTGIIRVSFDCGKCGVEVLDVAKSGGTNEQLEQFSKATHNCTSCGQSDYPRSVYECGYDERFNRITGGCAQNITPKKTSIFDCVLWVQREGEGVDTDMVITKVETIAAFRMQDGQLSPDGRPLSEHLKEIVRAPFNLSEMYAPESLDAQSETVRIPNPYAQGQAQQAQGQPRPQFQSYGPPQGPGAGMVAQMSPGQPLYPNMPVPGRPNFSK